MGIGSGPGSRVLDVGTGIGLMALMIAQRTTLVALDMIAEHKLNSRRLSRVKPATGKAAKRVLLECSYLSAMPMEDDLTIETQTRHRYTDQFRILVNEFYL